MGRMILALILSLALGGCDGGADTSGTATGGHGATTSSDGGHGGGCVDPHDASCVPYRPEPVTSKPFEDGPSCPVAEGVGTVAVQAIVQDDGLTDESGNVLSEAGALAVRCEPVTGVEEIDSVEYDVYKGFSGLCAPVEHDLFVWLTADLPTSLSLADAAAKEHVSADAILFDGPFSHRGVKVGATTGGGWRCFGVTMTVDDSTGGRNCVAGCANTEVETPDQDLYSDTINGTVQCPDADGNCLLEPMAVSPTKALGAEYNGPTRKMRFRWFGKRK